MKTVKKTAARKKAKVKKTKQANPSTETTRFMAMKFVKAEVFDPVVVQTAKGFRVTGHSDDGQPLSAIVSKERAMEAIQNGSAKQGW